MTDALFPLGLEGFLAGEIDADTAVFKLLLVHGYTYDATDKFVSDMTGGGGSIVATSAALSSKSVTLGVFDAADLTVSAVTGSSVDELVLIQASAVTGGADVAASAQRLVAFINTYTGLPITPNGGDISVAWPNDANKIFKL